jgi:hypothetical protein
MISKYLIYYFSMIWPMPLRPPHEHTRRHRVRPESLRYPQRWNRQGRRNPPSPPLINQSELRTVFEAENEIATAQRLGYLLD